MVAVSVLCAPSESEARWLSGSTALSILQLRTGRLGPLPSPEEAAAYQFTPAEKAVVDEAMSTHLIGDPDMVTDGLRQLQDRTGADEIMLSTRSHSYEGRVRSLSLIAQSWGMGAPARAGRRGRASEGCSGWRTPSAGGLNPPSPPTSGRRNLDEDVATRQLPSLVVDASTIVVKPSKPASRR